MKYQKGYKYQLVQAEKIQLIGAWRDCSNKFIILNKGGELTCKAGYAWDGASGPALDTQNFMRGSLAHDALYQLFRERLLPRSFKDQADLALVQICKEDGMWKLRRMWVLWALKNFGMSAATKPKKIYEV